MRFRKRTRSTAARCCGGLEQGLGTNDQGPTTTMGRTWAIIERELRRFRRSPVLIAMSMVMPIVQLVVLGYAFGGNVKHLKLAIVDQDHGMPAVPGGGPAAAPSSRGHTRRTLAPTP